MYPYDYIHILPPKNHGWFREENINSLTEILQYKKIETVIEVGSWLGLSTIFFGNNSNKVYAIDTWLGGSDHQKGSGWEHYLPNLYQQFLSNIIHASLVDKVIPIRMKSVEAAMALNIKADLIYIDASHETLDVVDDILFWMPHLNPNGVMCGDDYDFDTVKNGVGIAAKRFNRKIHNNGCFWRLI